MMMSTTRYINGSFAGPKNIVQPGRQYADFQIVTLTLHSQFLLLTIVYNISLHLSVLI